MLDHRRYGQVKAIKLGEAEPNVAFLSQVPAKSGLTQPSCFQFPVDKADLKQLRDLGFCPIHRHPVMANFIHVLHTLLASEFSKCLQSIDLPKAQLAYSMAGNFIRKYNGMKYLDYIYNYYILFPSKTLNQGLHMELNVETDERFELFEVCKGFIPYYP